MSIVSSLFASELRALRIAAIGVALAASFAGARADAQVRIMPLGDSITDGDLVEHTTYRCNLWAALEAQNYAVDFVGSQHGAAGQAAVCGLSVAFDADHEGHSGWKVEAVLEWISDPLHQVSPPPDVVLIHLGVTNLIQDLFDAITLQTGQPPTPAQVEATIANALHQISLVIDELRSQNPNVSICLAQIIPADVNFAGFIIPFAAVEVFNDRIPALAAEKDTDASRVFVIDQHTGYDPVFDSIGGIHPNAQGEQKLANGWLPRLKFILDSIPCSQASVATIVSDTDPESILPGNSVTLTASVDGGTIPNLYQWRRNGIAILGATGPSYTIPSITILEDGVYDCVAGNLCTTLVSNGIALLPGAFEPPVHYAVGVGPSDVAVADLGASPDGAIDFASCDSLGDSITIRWNDGAGGFAAAPVSIAVPPGEAPRSIVAADLATGAGLEIAVACAGSGGVRVFADAGGYVEVANIAAPPGATHPSTLAAGDLDGDAIADLVIAYSDPAPPEYPETPIVGDLAIVLDPANAASAISLPAPPAGFRAVMGVVAADLDGDGDRDIAAVMAGTVLEPSNADNVLLYENTGGAVFQYVGALSADQNPTAICTGDLDGDGRADLAVAVESPPFGATGAVIVFRHDAGATLVPASFTASAPFPSGSVAIDLACADLGDDSIPGFAPRVDLVTASNVLVSVGVLYGFDGVGFAKVGSCASALDPHAIAIADLDGDRTPDVVIADASANEVSVSLALPRALAQKFGAGCAGTAGTPVIDSVSTPNYGSTTFQVTLSGARPFAPTLFGVSLGHANVDLGGCTLLIAPPFVLLPTYTDGAGFVAYPIGIPAEVAPFEGLNAYCQFFVYDPLGGYQSQIAFSDGLRLKFGNP